jgi:tetratricopeptide (TPR) repeat protein
MRIDFARHVAILAAIYSGMLCLQGCTPDQSTQAVSTQVSSGSLQEDLSTARQQADAKEYTGAEALLTGMIAQYEKAGSSHPQLVAEAYTLLSQVQLQLKKHGEAADSAREAISHYRKARLDESEGMVRALSNLGHGLAVSNQEEARQVLMQAKGLAEQIEVAAPLVRMGIEDGLADVLVRQGNMEVAEPHYLSALEILEKERPDEVELMIQALTNLGAFYQYLGQIDRSEGYFTRARTAIERSGQTDSPELVRILSGEAFIKYRRGECDAAASLLQEAIAVKSASQAPADASIAKVYHDLGAAYECAGNRSAAIEQYQLSLDILTTLNDPAAAHVEKRLQALEAVDFSPVPSQPADPAPPES